MIFYVSEIYTNEKDNSRLTTRTLGLFTRCKCYGKELHDGTFDTTYLFNLAYKDTTLLGTLTFTSYYTFDGEDISDSAEYSECTQKRKMYSY